jgi:3-hydroxybutyryl-CoA dehydratase
MDGLWFEELRVGAEYETATCAVTAAAVGAFAELAGDRNPLHLDDAAARRAGYPGRIAHGVLGLALATGLLNQLGLTRGTLLAFLGLSWDFRRPIAIDDHLRLRVRVAETRATRKPDRGIAVLHVTALNQTDAVVQEGELKMLVRRRERG